MKIDHDTLRMLASAAQNYQGYIEEHSTIDKRFSMYDGPNCGIEICRFDYDDVDHEQVDANAEYIAAMSPAAALSLLDENERLRSALDKACDELESSSDRARRADVAEKLRKAKP